MVSILSLLRGNPAPPVSRVLHGSCQRTLCGHGSLEVPGAARDSSSGGPAGGAEPPREASEGTPDFMAGPPERKREPGESHRGGGSLASFEATWLGEERPEGIGLGSGARTSGDHPLSGHRGWVHRRRRAPRRPLEAVGGTGLTRCGRECWTPIRTDRTLLRRVLGNLIKNALEASAPGETVTVGFDARPLPTFSVHNSSTMPEAVRLQVFQRSFSTKAQVGRGLGTYSVKLLTERYLGGTVRFCSEEGSGTTFVSSPGDLSAD